MDHSDVIAAILNERGVFAIFQSDPTHTPNALLFASKSVLFYCSPDLEVHGRGIPSTARFSPQSVEIRTTGSLFPHQYEFMLSSVICLQTLDNYIRRYVIACCPKCNQIPLEDFES